MSLREAVIEGTLQPDGTLVLNEKPDLPAGRVMVVLRPATVVVPPPQENWFDHLQRIRAQRGAEGYPFMNDAEMQAHLDWLREGDRIDALLRDVDEQPATPERS